MAKGFKTGGRQKGTLNKTTTLNREKLQRVFDDEMDSGRYMQSLMMLSNEDYVKAMHKLFSYVMPKACNSNSAEVPPDEIKVKKPSFRCNPVGEREEVEKCRAADPEEAEIARMIYGKKKNAPVTGDEKQEKPVPHFSIVQFPVATQEEIDEFEGDTELSSADYARLILWNEKNQERFRREDEEKLRNNPNCSSYVPPEPPPKEPVECYPE